MSGLWAWSFPPWMSSWPSCPSTSPPFLIEAIVRLGTLLPFEQAAAEVQAVGRIQVSSDTVRRLTEEAGAAQLAREQAALEAIEQEAPDGPAGPEIQQLSADGAMIRLVGGDWTEVRTLALGTVDPSAEEEEQKVDALAYFSNSSSCAPQP